MYMVIGYGAGGGYDLYGRIAAEFLGKHIPGNPIIVPQNMPGAGSFKAAQYLYAAAPKDGTYLGSVSQTLAIDTAMSEKGNLDASKLPYLGRLTSNIDTGVALLKTGIKSFEDVQRKQYTVGTTGGASTAVLLPASLNAFGGAKFKLVKGYQGAADVLLALERGEVDIAGAVGIPNLVSRHPDWLKGGASIIYQAALKRNRLLPNVPTLPELGQTEDGKSRAAGGRQHLGDRPLDPDHARRAGGAARGAAQGVRRHDQGPGLPGGLQKAQHHARIRHRRGNGRDRQADAADAESHSGQDPAAPRAIARQVEQQ